MGPIGVFGGTFDPVHYGHLRSAWELLESLSLSQVRFVLCVRPPHREAPATDSGLRLRMLESAIAGEPRFVADTRELERSGPSYTVDTLESLRNDFPDRPLCLLLGMDAFLGLPQWHRWSEIPDLAHLVVAHRPGWQAPAGGVLGRLVRDRGAHSPAELHEQPAGRIHVQAVTQLEISASALRRAIAGGRDPKYLMPEPVREMILERNCYAEEKSE